MGVFKQFKPVLATHVFQLNALAQMTTFKWLNPATLGVPHQFLMAVCMGQAWESKDQILQG